MSESISRERLAKSLALWLDEADLLSDREMVWPVACDMADHLFQMLMRISLNAEVASR